MDYELIKQTDEITVGTEEEAKALKALLQEKRLHQIFFFDVAS